MAGFGGVLEFLMVAFTANLNPAVFLKFLDELFAVHVCNYTH